MAGARFKLDVSALKPLEARVRVMAGMDTSTLMPRLGEYLQQSVKDRFKTQTAPDGATWQALQPHTIERKEQNKDKILVESGLLGGRIHYQIINDHTVEVGSDRPYAAMHQFGGTTSPRSMIPNKPIPARPFLGISSKDEHQIDRIIKDWAARQGYK